ncbi:nuclear transport factor 2 family protein [Psychroserpens burtonensis]|uniref:Nuclear transport factor 2 family protein n=1 Tax=Psychroserpens burtonensis TaxID=49278 RepID=A0A5C7BDE6_9FLAO|nr:nuclear transport factor 2 family protein [Psychroserpens burtonensis]TXE19917.1 nuclear transport factor 2 family protein [Psychroserpens burtonensis]
MIKTLLLVIILTISLPIISQSRTDDLTLITTTIQNYYNGYIERDIDKLNTAFDTEYETMKVPVDNKNSSKGYKNVYFKDLIPEWGNREKLPESELNNCALHILNIDIEAGNIATAKMSMKVGDVTYIDILSLHNINGAWKITNKIYYVK